MHDSFAVIRWGAAGIALGAAGLMWSLSVAAEVIVVLLIPRARIANSIKSAPEAAGVGKPRFF
jgi:PPP family 3-phenylpropionic acid transporter